MRKVELQAMPPSHQQRFPFRSLSKRHVGRPASKVASEIPPQPRSRFGKRGSMIRVDELPLACPLGRIENGEVCKHLCERRAPDMNFALGRWLQHQVVRAGDGQNKNRRLRFSKKTDLGGYIQVGIPML